MASSSYCKNIDADLYYDQAWHILYQGSFPTWQWVETSFSQHDVLKARIRFHCRSGLWDYITADLYELQFYRIIEGT